MGEKLDGLNSTTWPTSWQSASLETQRTNQDGTLDTPRWTVDRHECTVGNIGHMVDKLDGHEWTTLGEQWKPKPFRP